MKKKALKGSLLEYTFEANKKQRLDIEMFLISLKDQLKVTLKQNLKKLKNLKFDISAQVVLGKLEIGQERERIIHTRPWFKSSWKIVNNKHELERRITSATEKVLDSYDNYMRMGSGWFLVEVLQMKLNIYKYKPLRGGCIASKLPEPYDKMRGILTFEQTGDQKCFLYCVLAHLYPQKTKKNDFLQYKKYETKLKTESLSFPVGINEITTFEKDNDLSINVYVLEKEDEGVTAKSIRVSENCDNANAHINLLLHKKHFHLITNISTFLRYRNKHRRWQCSRCLTFHSCQENLANHRKFCNDKRNGTSLQFPRHGERQMFKNVQNIPKAPFVMYCDLETYASSVSESQKGEGKTKKEAKHKAMAFGLYCVCSEEEFSDEKPTVYVGEDAIEKLFEELKKKIDGIHDIQKTVNYPIHMSKTDKRRHKKAKRCYVCRKRFEESHEKLRDHNHLRRRKNYLGPVCVVCNLHCSDLKEKVPVFMHNAGRFDLHLLIEKLHHLKGGNFHILPKTSETFTAMSMFGGKVEIRDSINHLPNALSDLVELNKESGKSFPHTAKSFHSEGPGSLKLIVKKGIFPHGYMTEFRKLEDETLPDRSAFYDPLREMEVSEADYLHAEKVFKHFACRSLRDYMMVYLTSDVTLLADIFEAYRDFFKTKFDLDPAHYVSLPSLSYDCAMKYTRCKIDYIHDEETYQFVKQAIRGGVSTICRRYAKANNTYLGGENYTPNKPTSFIMYFDCNSLYSSVMTMSLPYRNFTFIPSDEFGDVEEKIMQYRDDDKVGYFIECDLKYPTKIHDETRDLPFAPQHFKVQKKHLSPYNKQLVNTLGIQHYEGTKLLSDQYDRVEYISHIGNLKFYLEKGMKLEKIHKVLRFEQKPFLKPYIDLCIAQKAKSSSAIEKNLWKLACNSIFGKTITNLEKRSKVGFATSEKHLINSVNSPLFKSASIINSKLVQTNKAYRTVKVNSPYLLGAAVLEISKLVLFRWHYDFFVKRYGRENIELCMTDTDSLLYMIFHEDVYKDLRNEDKFDFSNYPRDNPVYNEKCKGQLFCLKDEVGGKPIKSFIGLRAKSYSLEFADESRKVTGKGIPRSKLKQIQHSDMKKTLFKKQKTHMISRHIRSYKHKLYNIAENKLALSPFDNKRFLLDKGIYTLPLGHYLTELL